MKPRHPAGFFIREPLSIKVGADPILILNVGLPRLSYPFAMPQFSVDVDVLRDALFDRSLSQVGDSLLQTRITSPLRISGWSFTPSASFGVRVFNRAEDRDSDAVIGRDADSHVPFATQSAWLKYTLSAKAEGTAGLAVMAAGASRDVELSDYRIHSATDGAWHALQGDLASPRTLLELEEVRQLAPGEALTMELDGALSASVTFSWADVLSTKLAEVLSEVPAGAPIAVKLASGLETTVSVKVTDQFSTVISRTKENLFRFAVKKAASRSNSYGVEASVGWELSALPAIDEVLDSIMEALIPHLAPSEVIEQSSGALDELRTSLRNKLAAAARWKAATGFAYEYGRIDENSAIADFVLLDEGLLASDYALMLSGDFVKIAEALRSDPGSRSLVRYLNESTLTHRASFGFSLGIGKWVDLQTKDETVFRSTTRTSLDGSKLVVSRGTRKYEEKGVPENDFEWVVDLKAEMKSFVPLPSTLDFEYGLHLMATLDRDAVDQNDLERMLDFAAMWGINVPPVGELAGALGKRAQIRVQLLFERDALEAALARPAFISSWAAPLAMAMPYMSRFTERRSFAARAATYTPAWKAWLTGETNISLTLPSGITIFERRGGPGSFRWTSGEGHAHLRQRLESFVGGAQHLHEAMTTAQPTAAIREAFQSLHQFWSQRLYVAAAGRWLLDRAPTTNRSMQIDLGTTTITV